MSVARRAWAGISLAGTFVYDLVVASLAVARIVLAPHPRPMPAIVRVPVDARTDWGIALFAYLVSMTPGSTCLYVAEDRSALFVHFLHAPDEEQRAAEIKALFESRIRRLEGERVST
jgi:multisubunit Na+/H+ antiporter MnhE subunit